MIKYIEYDSVDETGEHIIPVNSLYDLNKTASGTYSQELMKVIHNLKRREDRYYVVINALGSHEVWGNNRNGDAFPEKGLTHLSLRTDMGTPNDYGYKTFEYYAKWFKNHVNKPTSPSFGEVVYAHWNPTLHRVELIVAIDRKKDAKTVAALENGKVVSVSMGCKVPFDECSICGNKAKTRKQYCKHARDYLGQIVTEQMARTWSRELGKTILPGAQVFVYNWTPRFFDISDVFIGADRTSFVLGKAASVATKARSSLDVPEAWNITDEDIDKVAVVRKRGEITKQVGGALGPNDIDGRVTKADVVAIPKPVEEKVKRSIEEEPMLPKEFLDGIAKTRSLPSIFSTMLGMGIFPKPREVQRIVLVNIGKGCLANDLDSNNEVFDYESPADPVDIPDSFDDSLSRLMIPYLAERSSCPHFLLPRMDYVEKKASLEKRAYYSSTMGNDYWIDQNPQIGIKQKSITSPGAAATLAGLATVYAGLKAKSMGIGAKDMAKIFVHKPWLAALIGGSVMYNLYNAMDKIDIAPAAAYGGRLQDTNFTGHIKSAKAKDVGTAAGNIAHGIGKGLFAAGIAFPGAYMLNAMQQKSYETKGKPLFPVQSFNPKTTAIAAGATAGLTPIILSAIKRKK